LAPTYTYARVQGLRFEEIRIKIMFVAGQRMAKRKIALNTRNLRVKVLFD